MTLKSGSMDPCDTDREHDTTLLAKALFDNLADAPDELSFRKGDIVTVIEQDVDGLVGWWLCILHGRQGIAPGNRLQVLSDVDRKSINRPTRRGSYSTDDFSDSQDGSWVSDISPSLNLDYDTIPSSTRGGYDGSESRPDRLSVKELYDIPLGHGGDTLRRGLSLLQSQGLETYDLPTTLPRGSRVQRQNHQPATITQDEVYDHPQAANEAVIPRYSKPRTAETSTEETYNAPRRGRKESLELYDVPHSQSKAATPEDERQLSSDESQILYDVPQGGIPHRGRSYNISSASPPGTPKSPHAADLFQVPAPNAIGATIKDPLANYDVPRKLPQYDTPRRHTDPQEIYDIPPRGGDPNAEEVYDVPSKAKGHLLGGGSSTLPARSKAPVADELYDVPAKSSLARLIPDSVSNKNDYNEQLSREDNGKPIYHRPSLSGGSSISKSLPGQNTLANTSINNNVEIYDSPSSSRKGSAILNPDLGSELYDVPSRKASGVEEMYDIPPSQHEGSVEIYDTPSKQTLTRNNMPPSYVHEDTIQQEVYDTPPAHDVNKVMAAIGIDEARKRLVKAAAAGGGHDSDDDDYVDYEDIYGREPPSYLVKAMDKESISPTHPTTKPPGVKRQQSVLEQINMGAVKELNINASQAIDRLAKLHLAVDTSVTALLGFIEDDWLNPVSLRNTIGAIRDMAGKVKIALRLLTEFGLGALVNAQKTKPGSALINDINSNVEPLVESYYKIKVCLLHLESNNWVVPSVRDPENEKFFATVNAIMILSERIPENCRKMNSVLQANLEPLFGPDTSNSSPISENVQELRTSSFSPGSVRQDLKGKLKQIGPIDPKTVRGILDIDQRMSYQASPHIYDQRRATTSSNSSSGTLRRRQEVMTSTLPRPPVPPKPSLPNNRKSLAIEPPEPVWVKSPVMPRVETLVTEYAVESPRIKYNSDPTRSPSDFEKNKNPVWGGSCPSLQSQHSAVTERGFLNPKYPEEPMPNSVSQGDVGTRTSNSQLPVNVVRKLPSESNIHDPELAPNALLHSRSASMPYDEKDAKFPSLELETPASPERASPKVAKLDHRDIETLEFFLRQVEAQVMILRGAMKNLTESVEKNNIPQVFVAHSKFVILTAHKVVHAAEEVTERLIDQDVTQRIRRENVLLTDNIRAVVAATKTAALDYPNNTSMVDMISTVLSLGESVRDIHGEAKRALAL